MEENIPQTPQSNLDSDSSLSSVSPKPLNKILIFVVLLAIVVVGGAAAMYFLNKGYKTTATNSYVPATSYAPTAVPTQAQGEIQNKSTSLTQLDSDMQTVNNSYDKLNTDTNALDNSLNDKETNLQ